MSSIFFLSLSLSLSLSLLSNLIILIMNQPIIGIDFGFLFLGLGSLSLALALSHSHTHTHLVYFHIWFIWVFGRNYFCLGFLPILLLTYTFNPHYYLLLKNKTWYKSLSNILLKKISIFIFIYPFVFYLTVRIIWLHDLYLVRLYNCFFIF